MSDSLEVIQQQSYDLAKRSVVQFVPNVYIIRELFERLPPINTVPRDYYDMQVELQKETMNRTGGSYERLAIAPVRFYKILDNGNLIWLYVGPLKQV